VLLAHKGDAHAKNQYGKSAVDFSQDELDAAENVYKDNSSMRTLLEEFGISKVCVCVVEEQLGAKCV
jgi:hypothetical protein